MDSSLAAIHTTTTAAVVSRAMQYPMDAVTERYARDKQLPIEVAKEHERELKRFLALNALAEAKDYGMAGPVDDLWHTFILFTHEYQRFCKEIAGTFLHHIPHKPQSEDDGTSYRAFLADYESAYGEPAPAHIWPRLLSQTGVSGHCGGGGSCTGNGCGSDKDKD